MKLKAGIGPVVRVARRSDTQAEIYRDTVNVPVSGGTSVVVSRADASVMQFTGATYYAGGRVIVDGSSSREFVVTNRSVGALTADGTITRLTPGVLNVLLRLPGVTLPLTVDLTDVGGGNSTVGLGALSGSLAAHVSEMVDSRINSGMTMGVNGTLFATQNHTAGIYTRNPALWCGNINLTCISPWNNNGANTRAGTLVTPRHVLNAAHYELNVGNTIRFVASDGAAHNRNITGKKRHPDYPASEGFHWPDLTIYTLNEDLPAAIQPCQVMPANYAAYLVENTITRPACLGLDQEEKALIVDFYGGTLGSAWGGGFNAPVDPDRLIFNEEKIVGDSGNPAFMIVNNALVLITVWTYGGSGSGTPVARFLPDLNQMIIDADNQAGVTGAVANPTWPNSNNHYQLKPADFSAFPNYS